MGGAPWHAVAHKVPEAVTTELADNVQVYRESAILGVVRFVLLGCFVSHFVSGKVDY